MDHFGTSGINYFVRMLENFWEELVQRGVLKAAVIYAVMGFFVLLLADLLAYALPYPVWLKPLLLQTLLLGVPLTGVAVWVFDLRREIRPIGGRDLDEIMVEERQRSVSAWKTTGIIAGSLIFTFLMSAFVTVRKDESPVSKNERIVIAPLENRTDDYELDELGPVIADWTAQRLTQTRQFDVVPFTSIEQYAAIAGFSAASSNYAHALELARGTGAGLVVWGSYYLAGDSIRFAVQLTDARSGELVRDLAPVSAARANVDAALAKLRESIAFTIARETIRRAPSLPLYLPPFPKLSAHESFSNGLHLFAKGNFRVAAASFQDAWKDDTTFVTARLWQARSLAEAGALFEAATLAASLDSSRALLSIYDRTMLDRISGFAGYNPDLRYGSSTILQMAAPASDEATRYLAIDALALNHPREARNVLQSVDADHGSIRAWPDYYTTYALAEHLIGNYRGEVRVARQARMRFPRDAEIAYAMCRALAATGQAEEALAAIRGVKSGSAILRCAQELIAHGQKTAGMAAARLAVTLYESQPTGINDRLDYPIALLVLNQPQRAYNAMLQIVDEDMPSDMVSVAQFRIALCAQAAGMHDEAVAREVTALENLGNSPYVTLERARLQAARSDATEAFHLFADAVAGGLPYAESARVLPHADYTLRILREATALRQMLAPRG